MEILPDQAALHYENDSSIYADGTILGDMPTSKDSCLSFGLNGDSVDNADEEEPKDQS